MQVLLYEKNARHRMSRWRRLGKLRPYLGDEAPSPASDQAASKCQPLASSPQSRYAPAFSMPRLRFVSPERRKPDLRCDLAFGQNADYRPSDDG